MRLLIVAYEFPYPANHGGKIDIWNRIRALKNAGAEIFLLTWYQAANKDVLSENDINAVEQVADHLVVLPTAVNARRILNMVRYPSLVAARMIEGKTFERILSEVSAFAPQSVLIDGVYAGQTGLKFARRLGVPVYLRSHNIEHQYMLGQYQIAYNFKSRISIMANLHNLRQYEHRIMRSVDAYFDISIEDMEFWKSKGCHHGYWLPFIVANKNSSVHGAQDDTALSGSFDVGYFGNLNTPNNVKGIIWFLEKVLPLLKRVAPGIRVVIAGSHPSDELLNLCERIENLTVIANPPDMQPVVEDCKILINPLRFGSGVNIKSLEMLFSSKQVVTTSVGIKGITPDIQNAFYVADTPEAFAKNIAGVLAGKQRKDLRTRNNLRNQHGEDAARKLLAIMGQNTVSMLSTSPQTGNIISYQL